jgi:cytochrome c553
MRSVSVFAFVLIAAMTSAASAQDVPAYVAACTACHGAGGNPQVDSTPRLNGQQKDYLLKRLNEFRSLGSLSQHGGISDQTRPAIAAWFAAQKPTPAKPGPLSAVGRR